jgi:hypothetical protein
MNELVKTIEINPNEFGIEEKQATELIANLPQIINERSVLERQYSEVIKLDIEQPESWVKARELRLLIQKNRTQGIMIWHKSAKDYFLKGGQFVDAIKRKEVAINERMENALQDIENYEKIIEQKRLEELQEKRAKKLSKYVDDAHERNLSDMEEDVWKAYFETKKKQYEDRIEAEKKAEQERIQKERKEKLHNERKNSILDLWQFVPEELKQKDFSDYMPGAWELEVSNIQKNKFKYEKEQERIKKENERLQKEAEEQRKNIEDERKAREAKDRKEREEYEAKLKAEREEKQRIENELKAKQEAEQKAKEEEEKRIQTELNKGDKAKVQDLINDLSALKTKYTFKSKKNQKMYSDVRVLIGKIIGHINEV